MKRVMAGPILGEFGWLVYDIQPHVRAWLKAHPDDHKVVVVRKEFNYFFPEADEYVDIPAELVPPKDGGRGWWKGQVKRHMEKAIDWTRGLKHDEMMDIPWFGQHGKKIEGHKRGDWKIEPVYERLTTSPPAGFHVVPEYLVTSCRDRPDWGHAKNWSHHKWDELIERVVGEWGLVVYCIGKEGRSYFPKGTYPVPPPIENAVYALNHAKFFFASNSGPTHLSQFCGCPTFSWGVNNRLKGRMERADNHLGTPTYYVGLGWDADVMGVFTELKKWAVTL